MNNSALHKLAIKTGATRLEHALYDLLRNIGSDFLQKIVNTTLKHTNPQHQTQKSNKMLVCINHVSLAIKDLAETFYGAAPLKLEDCVIFAKSSIAKEVQTLSGTGYRWSEEALNTVRELLENFLSKVLFSGLLIMKNDHRKTLTKNDIQVAIDLVKFNRYNETPKQV